MKTFLALLLSCLTLSAATTYPVLTDSTNRLFPGGVTNVFFLNSNVVTTGTMRATGALTLTNSGNVFAGDGSGLTGIGGGGGTNAPLLNGTNTFTGSNIFSSVFRVSGDATITNSSSIFSGAGYGSAQQTLSYSSGTNLTVDASKSLHFVSLTNTAYFAQPSSLVAGASFTVILKQDSTGTRGVTFNTNYWKFPNGTQPSITTNANAYDVLSCIACPYGTNVFTVHNAKFQ